MKLSRDTRRTLIWLSITAVLAVSSFIATSSRHGKIDKSTFFDWSALQGGIGELIILGIPALLLTLGERRELLALRRPRQVGRTALLAVAAVVGTLLLSGVMSHFGNLTKEQGLAPSHWVHHHTLEFVVSVFAVSVLVPIAEESFFRGAGVGLLSRVYSVPGAVVLSGCLFALIHGLVLGFLPLAFFGTMLALMRVTSRSLLPGILLHGAYNALAVFAAIDFKFH